MSAAPRNNRRRGWPRGLYEPRPSYYTWRSPDGVTYAIGRVPFNRARDEALAANAHVSEHKPSLVARLMGADRTVADALDLMPVPTVANTAKQYRSRDRVIRGALGTRGCGEVTVRDVALMLDAIPPSSAVGVRSRLSTVFRKAMAKGWCNSNPADSTERPQVDVKRGRLLYETFQAIRAECPAWAQRAMDVALVLGCDVSTLATLHADMRDGDVFTFTRAKTGVRIAVPVSLHLAGAGLRLRELLPARGPVVVDPDPHGNAGELVSASRISGAFTLARRALGLPDANDGGPSFHEIRSLAKRMYERQGNVDTLALLGHLDERTGARYADPRGVEAITVRVD